MKYLLITRKQSSSWAQATHKLYLLSQAGLIVWSDFRNNKNAV